MNRVAIIGAGPAGITAAVQLMRTGISPLIIEKKQPGGLLINANLVENYPGFPNGIAGYDLAERMLQQLAKWRIPVIQDEVLSLSYENDLFTLTGRNNKYTAEFLLLAAGTRPVRDLGIDIAQSQRKYIFYEAGDLKHISGGHITIIGSGDGAFDYALNLAGRNHVGLFCRAAEPKALGLLIDRAAHHRNIEIHYSLKLIRLLDDEKGLMCHFNDFPPFRTDALVAAVGRNPRTELTDTLDKNILTNLRNNKRLWLAGDMINGLMRQTAVAVGDGMRAAIEIIDMIKRIL